MYIVYLHSLDLGRHFQIEGGRLFCFREEYPARTYGPQIFAAWPQQSARLEARLPLCNFAT